MVTVCFRWRYFRGVDSYPLSSLDRDKLPVSPVSFLQAKLSESVKFGYENGTDIGPLWPPEA